MASRYDMLLADAASAATLYDDDGASNPRRVSVILSNAKNLRNARNLSDYTDGIVPAGTAVEAGQVVATTQGWFMIAKVLDLSAVSFRAPPIKLLLLHLDDALAGTRGNEALSLRVMIRDVKSKEADGIPEEELTVLCPLGADVHIGDQYTYGAWVWRVQDVTPALVDGHPYAQETRWERYAPTAGTAPYLLTNATVTCKRNGTTMFTGHAVRWIWTNPQDMVQPEGFVTPASFRDQDMSVDWRAGDYVVLEQLDGRIMNKSYEIFTAHPLGPLPRWSIVVKGDDK